MCFQVQFDNLQYHHIIMVVLQNCTPITAACELSSSSAAYNFCSSIYTAVSMNLRNSWPMKGAWWKNTPNIPHDHYTITSTKYKWFLSPLKPLIEDYHIKYKELASINLQHMGITYMSTT